MIFLGCLGWIEGWGQRNVKMLKPVKNQMAASSGIGTKTMTRALATQRAMARRVGRKRGMTGSFMEGFVDMQTGAVPRSGMRPWCGVGLVWCWLAGLSLDRERLTHEAGCP